MPAMCSAGGSDASQLLQLTQQPRLSAYASTAASDCPALQVPAAGGAHAALYHPSAVVEHAKAKIDKALGTNLGGEAAVRSFGQCKAISRKMRLTSQAPCLQH